MPGRCWPPRGHDALRQLGDPDCGGGLGSGTPRAHSAEGVPVNFPESPDPGSDIDRDGPADALDGRADHDVRLAIPRHRYFCPLQSRSLAGRGRARWTLAGHRSVRSPFTRFRHRPGRHEDRARLRHQVRRWCGGFGAHRHRHGADAGEGFESAVSHGERVEAGQLLAIVDRAKVLEAGYDTTTLMVVTNSKDMPQSCRSPRGA